MIIINMINKTDHFNVFQKMIFFFPQDLLTDHFYICVSVFVQTFLFVTSDKLCFSVL